MLINTLIVGGTSGLGLEIARELSGQEGDYKYRFAKIMRDPARVEIVETR